MEKSLLSQQRPIAKLRIDCGSRQAFWQVIIVFSLIGGVKSTHDKQTRTKEICSKRRDYIVGGIYI